MVFYIIVGVFQFFKKNYQFNMCRKKLYSIKSKYLDNCTNKDETRLVLDCLMKSERERHIMNLAAAGLRCMQPDNR